MHVYLYWFKHVAFLRTFNFWVQIEELHSSVFLYCALGLTVPISECRECYMVLIWHFFIAFLGSSWVNAAHRFLLYSSVSLIWAEYRLYRGTGIQYYVHVHFYVPQVHALILNTIFVTFKQSLTKLHIFWNPRCPCKVQLCNHC